MVVHSISISGVVMPYRPVLVHVDPDDWEQFKKLCENYKMSKRVRELIKADIARKTKQPVES
jgi:hypothetical protein